MDSPLPALHPIVLSHISSPPFEYSPKGLTFKGHLRGSVADLKQWLFPKRKSDPPPNKVKDWWVAQLRLYGFDVKASTKKEDVIDALKSALASGLDGPPWDLLELERKLKREFLLRNEEERQKEYLLLSEEERAEKYSERFLTEKFFNGVNNERLLALEVDPLGRSFGQVHMAAAMLGLYSVTACGPQRRVWTIIGKKKRHVIKRKVAIEEEGFDWESKKRAAKRRRRAAEREEVEQRRQKLEAGGEGSFKDVEGEWSIQCPMMDKECRKVHRSMSIFFDSPPTSSDGRSEKDYMFNYVYRRRDGYGSEDGGSDSEDDDELCYGSEDHDEGEEEDDSPILYANFKMGLYEGMLRSRVDDHPAQSSSFPVRNVEFNWRGIDMSGLISFSLDSNSNVGSFDFISKTRLKGVFNRWPFTGTKVSEAPDNTRDVWEDYSREAYERANVARCRR
ncbi:hypothetical protein KC19_11G032600 [Ceratodon purpureus]|uniref:Uncharacterized protein n=1 Tax=Ceratodon purpureus TaxID=3225 RepID=A0A8T0GAM0_CERPU|nr:hypothetical protein KC19_11G032600 [Ceratodon purpureus]